jgi:putative Holliday junction resolvase
MPDTPELRPESIIALDFGLRRIGVAIGQQVTDSATAIGVISNGPNGPDWRSLELLIAEWQPARLVVGLPSHQDGSPGPMAPAIAAFIEALGRFGRPVECVDENHTSQEAAELLKKQRSAGMRGRVRREMIDSTAAVLIAERWLREGRAAIGRENNRHLV